MLTAGCGEDAVRRPGSQQSAVSASDPVAGDQSLGDDPSGASAHDSTDGGSGGGRTDGPGGTAGTDESESGTSATEELTLSQQVQLVAGGDGLFPQCRLGDGAPDSPSAPDESYGLAVDPRAEQMC